MITSLHTAPRKPKTCAHCRKPFTGRANKIYCSTTCKNKVNKALELRSRGNARMLARHFLRNERVLNSFMTHNAKPGSKVYKSELEAFGFKTKGPFWLYFHNTYVVGMYTLRDYDSHFVIEKILPSVYEAMHEGNHWGR